MSIWKKIIIMLFVLVASVLLGSLARIIVHNFKNISFEQLIPLYLIVLWLLITYFSSWCGWRKLAVIYSIDKEPDGFPFYFVSGYVGLIYYRYNLYVTANTEGIYVVPIFIFRPGHSPLFIPWNDIKIGKWNSFFTKKTLLSVSKGEYAEFIVDNDILKYTKKETI